MGIKVELESADFSTYYARLNTDLARWRARRMCSRWERRVLLCRGDA